MDINYNTLVLSKLRDAAALLLWKSGAIKINLREPFKLVSGNYSPIYINCRQVISDPAFISLYCTAVRILIEEQQLKVDLLAGGETAGIPFSAYLAKDLSKPMVYVRKAKKGYGLANLVEGQSPENLNAILIEDLITNAGSKIHFIDALKAAGAQVNDVLVLFDRLQGGKKALAEVGINLHSITDLNSVIDLAREASVFPESDLVSVESYLSDPEIWHQNLGLEFVK